MPEFSDDEWDEIYEASDPYLKYELTDKGRAQVDIIKQSDPQAAWKRIMSGPPAQMAFFTFLMGLDRGISVSEIYNLVKSRGASEKAIREGLGSLIQNKYIEQVWEDPTSEGGDHPWPERF